MTLYIVYHTWENFGGGINWQIVNHSPIFYSPIISVLEIQESIGVIVIRVSLGKVCPAHTHASLGMHACVPSVIHVPPHTFHYRDACFLDYNAPTQLRISNQIKLNEDIRM